MTATTNGLSNEKVNGDTGYEALNDIEPPAPQCAGLQNPMLLLLQTLYLLLISIPVIVYSIIERLFQKKKSLKGKVVVITGAGRGLGQGFALKFAQLGCTVACADINEVINQHTVEMINKKYPGKAKAYKCNVALSQDIRALRESVIADFGQVDILLHNAGLIAATPSVAEFDDIYLHGVIAVNLSSHFFMIREFLPDMLKRNQGHIVAVASIAGHMSVGNASMYCATKHGVVGLMESLHYELQDIPNNNINTSVICPYFVNTSALYTRFWKTRMPELSIDELVNHAVAGIRRNERVITTPSYMYPFLIILKLLPDRLARMIRDVFYVKIIAPSVEFQKTTPIFKSLIKSINDIDLGYERQS